jgi:hypothetical protein
MSAAPSRWLNIDRRFSGHAWKAFPVPIRAPGRWAELVDYENRHDETSPRRRALDNFQ